MKPIARCVAAAVLLAAVAVPAAAQDANVRPGTAAAPANLPLQVQIVIARYQNDKRVSSLPFSLSMSSAPGSKPLSHNIWKPLQTPKTLPPRLAKLTTLCIMGLR